MLSLKGLTKERLAQIRAELLPPSDRAKIEETYGKVIGPMIDAKLEAKALEMLARYRAAWHQTFRETCGDVGIPREELLCTREQAAKMLQVHLSTIKRMEGNDLPEPVTFGERGVRHRLIDIEKLARIRGQAIVPLPD